MPPSNGYGTVDGQERRVNANGDLGGADDEEQPLLGSQPKVSYWQRRMMIDVRRKRADIILIICYIITGLLDSASISAWGSFVSMQTGMSVLLKEKSNEGTEWEG